MSSPSNPSAGTARPDVAPSADVDALIKEFEDAVSNSWRGPGYHNAKAALRSVLSAWQTEQTMHRAWRKRAEEAELEFTALRSVLAERDAECERLRKALSELREALPESVEDDAWLFAGVAWRTIDNVLGAAVAPAPTEDAT